MSRLPIAVVAALGAALLAAPVRADDPGEPAAAEAAPEASGKLPWWAVGDYPEAAAPAAPAEPEVAAAAPEAEPPPDAHTWWAGGDDAVLVLGGSEEPAALAAEPAAAPAVAAAEAPVDTSGSGLFHRAPDRRAEGHRAGEGPLDEDVSGSAGESGDTRFASEDDEQGAESETGSGAEPSAQDVVVEDARRDPPNQCNRYPKQIARYEAELEMAKERGNERAEALLEAQIARLEARDEKNCPRYEGPSTLEKTLVVAGKLVKLAAKVARYMYGSPF